MALLPVPALESHSAASTNSPNPPLSVHLLDVTNEVIPSDACQAPIHLEGAFDFVLCLTNPHNGGRQLLVGSG